MATGLFLAGTRRTQPRGPAQINWANPLTRGLRVWINYGNGRPALAGPGIPLNTSGASPDSWQGPFPNGVGRYSADNNEVGDTFTPWASTGQASMVVVQQAFSDNSGWMNVGQGSFLDHFPYGGAVESSAFWNSRWLTGATPPSGENFESCRVVGLSVRDGLQVATWNARPWVTNTLTGGFGWPSTMRLVASDTGGSWGFRGTIGLILMWDRALSQAELLSLGANPWQIYADDELLIGLASSGLSASAVEGGSATESAQAALSAAAAAAESATATDAGQAVGAATATRTEAATASDSSSSALSAGAAVNESATGTESASSELQAAAAATEAASAADTASAALQASAVITESASAGEISSAAAAGNYSAGITEAASASDSTSAALQAAAAVTEAASATESSSAAAAGNYSAGVTEAATATDAPSATLAAVTTLTESTTAADACTAALAAAAAVAESATATDASTGLPSGAYAAGTTEAATATDSATHLATLAAAVAEPATAQDASAAMRLSFAAALETATPIDVSGASWAAGAPPVTPARRRVTTNQAGAARPSNLSAGRRPRNLARS